MVWGCRLLDIASSSGTNASPKQRPVMEGALNLAIRLGLPTGALLDKVLDATSGAAFYENFRRAVSTISYPAVPCTLIGYDDGYTVIAVVQCRMHIVMLCDLCIVALFDCERCSNVSRKKRL